MTHETEHQTRLRRAKEAIKAYQDAEDAARIALANATQATKRAREKYDELFAAEENRIYQLLKNKQP
jgi:hypothetical protein